MRKLFSVMVAGVLFAAFLGAAAEAFLAARNDSDGHQDQ